MEGQALHVRLSAMIEGKVCSWTIADYLPLHQHHHLKEDQMARIRLGQPAVWCAYRSCISGAGEMQVNKSSIYRQDPTSTNMCGRPVACCCQGKVGDGEMISDKEGRAGRGVWRGAAWNGGGVGVGSRPQGGSRSEGR